MVDLRVHERRLVSPSAISKAGVEQLGRALRAELTQHGASASVGYFAFVDTEMVRQGFADPIAQRLGETIVREIEHRSPRIVAPRRWTALSLLRGVLHPVLDRHADRVCGRSLPVEGVGQSQGGIELRAPRRDRVSEDLLGLVDAADDGVLLDAQAP